MILRICDGVGPGNEVPFDEFKPLYGPSLVTGWARLHGHQIGILANAQGILFSEEAQKATQFIQLANQIDVPLLFLHNTTGYMVGKEYEQGGIIKHGAQMINAVSNSTVPHLSIVMGASYGAGNYGMNGRAYDPRFLFTWPRAKSAVMGPAQLAGVLSIVARAAAESKGKAYDEEADAGLRAYVEGRSRSRACRSSSPGWCTTTGSSTRATPAPSSASACPSSRTDPSRAPTASASSGCECMADQSRACLVANRGEIARRVFRDLPRPRHRDRRGALRRRRRACRSSRRPTSPYGCPGTLRPRPTCAATWSSRRRAGPAPTPSTPATASSPRTPTSPAPVHRRGADLGRPDAGVDGADGAPRSRPRS